MNKPNDVVSAGKLLKWIESDDRAEAFWIDGLDSTVAFDNLSDAIDAGELAPDTPPVPTIKPGDKVRHKDHGEGGVRSTEGTDVWVFFDKYDYDLLVSIWNLEVLGNE